MKRWKKIVALLLGLIVLSQLPFAYRRYKLGRLQAAIRQLNSQRRATQNDSGFTEYRGVIHVHSFLGGHSTGTFQDIISAANANQLNFVIMTEHPSKNFDTAAMTLNGVHAGVLFVNGVEVSTSNHDRLLLLPGDASVADADSLSTADIIAKEKTRGALSVVAYPQEFTSWQANGYDGVEVYNVFTNARKVNPLITFFDGLWSYRRYPDLLFATFYERPTESLRAWDDAMVTANRQLVATAGNDAHANIGFTLGDSSGQTLLGMKLDPYETSFRLVRMHVLIQREKPLSAETLLTALREGHCFIAFDLFGDATGFSFAATSGGERKIQGDTMTYSQGLRLKVSTPVTSRAVLLKNGTPIQEKTGESPMDFEIGERGAYRVEVYLPQLSRPVSEQPWIISNPIYVR